MFLRKVCAAHLGPSLFMAVLMQADIDCDSGHPMFERRRSGVLIEAGEHVQKYGLRQVSLVRLAGDAPANDSGNDGSKAFNEFIPEGDVAIKNPRHPLPVRKFGTVHSSTAMNIMFPFAMFCFKKDQALEQTFDADPPAFTRWRSIMLAEALKERRTLGDPSPVLAGVSSLKWRE